MHTVKIGNREFELRYDFNCLMRLEAEQGINAFDLPSGGVSPRVIIGLLWAGLLHIQPEPKVAELVQAISLKDAVKINRAVWAAYRAYLPDPEKTDEKPKE